MLLRIGRREAMRKKQVLQLLTMLTATAAVCAVLFLRHQPMEVAAVRVEKGNICRTVGVAGTVCYTQETPVTAMVSWYNKDGSKVLAKYEKWKKELNKK